MGNQRARQRKYVLFCLACCITITLGAMGCLYYPEKWKSEEHLARAKYFMERRNFKGALKESRTALELFPRSLGDRALYQIGLIYAHPENPDSNSDNSSAAFQKLITGYPNSALKTQSELWLMHLHHIQDLETTLKAKKKEIRQLKERIKNSRIRNKKLLGRYIQKVKLQEKEIQGLKQNIKRLKEIDLKIEEKKRKTIP